MLLAAPWFLIGLLLLPLLWLAQSRSSHPMSPRQRRWTGILRALAVGLVVLALARPSLQHASQALLTVAVVDQSASLGPDGRARAWAQADRVLAAVSGAQARVLVARRARVAGPDAAPATASADGSDLAAGLRLGRGLAAPAAGSHLILISDGHETAGDAVAAAAALADTGTRVDVLPVHGEARPDAWVQAVRMDRARVDQGATVGIEARIGSTVPAAVQVQLFEDGVQVADQGLELAPGPPRRLRFEREALRRGVRSYRVRISGLAEDSEPANDSAQALVEVGGRPLLLLISGDPDQAGHLQRAATAEGLDVVLRSPPSAPAQLAQLIAYDGVLLHDVPAQDLGAERMDALAVYVERYGGGLIMVGGERSFALGGYHRTPIDALLPVHIQPRDVEERQPTALMLVLDRSGSMGGEKMAMCKAAAIATADLLARKDHLGVIAFDSSPSWVVPLSPLRSDAAQLIGSINAGGGTNIQPAMQAGWDAMRGVQAGARHMIVLTDGHSGGSGYELMAAGMRAEGITVSTVAVGAGADAHLLDAIARAGGGTCYLNAAPEQLRAIFTQDTMRHLGRSLREEPFTPQLAEEHPMLAGWPESVPELLGYVRTEPRLTAQVPLITDLGEPLLAHWRVGLGKVTAFTSGADARWAPLWIAGWPHFDRFWAQVLRDTLRRGGGHRLQLETGIEQERLIVEAVVLDEQGAFVHDAEVQVDSGRIAVGSLGGAPEQPQRQLARQVGPGRYRAELPLLGDGIHLVRVHQGGRTAQTALVHSAAAEHAVGVPDLARLRAIATAGGGRLLDADSLPTSPPARPIERSRDLTALCILLALALFCCDVCLRRWDHLRSLAEWSRRRQHAAD